MTTKTQIGDVTYDAATQSFQALVTFYSDRGRVRVAASFAAPLTTGFDVACDGLWRNARKALGAPDALQARLHAKRVGVIRHQRRLPRLLPDWLQALTHRRAA